MDQFSIKPGDVYPWVIQQAAAHCKVMIALIGPQWLTVADKNSQRRLDNPLDFVRREITAALDRGVTVIPVRLSDAAIPTWLELPNEMRGLELLQMHSLSARRWREESAELVAAVQGALRRPD